jgi:hypothetical protein
MGKITITMLMCSTVVLAGYCVLQYTSILSGMCRRFSSLSNLALPSLSFFLPSHSILLNPIITHHQR